MTVRAEFESSKVASPEMETAILSALILDGDSAFEVTETLRVTDFALDSHRRIYRAILLLSAENSPIDYLTLRDCLAERKELESVGGIGYLADLTSNLHGKNPRAIRHYVNILRGKTVAREAANVCLQGSAKLNEGGSNEDPRLTILDIEAKLAAAREDSLQDGDLASQCNREMGSIRRERQLEESVFVPSGVEVYDATHSGFALGEVVVVGARPNIGKSSMLRMAVMENCRAGNFVHLFTPEMRAGQVIRYLASRIAEVPYRRLRHADRLSDEEEAKVAAAIREIEGWPLRIDDTSPLYPREMLVRARAVQRKYGTKLLGLDYLQKLKSEGNIEHRHLEITEMMVNLTGMAKTERMAVEVLSSITEPQGKDRNRPPTMADLRQSGDIQYEADIILLLHREIDQSTQAPVPECSIIIGKARSTQAGIKKVYFNSDYIFFEEQQSFLRGLGKS